MTNAKGHRVAEDLLGSQAPTHKERKATIRRVRVAARCEVARAARCGAVASHGQQRALRARHGESRAARSRRRPPRERAASPPRVPRAAGIATRHPLPTHRRRPRGPSCSALRAVARPAPDRHGPYISFDSFAANKFSKIKDTDHLLYHTRRF